MFVENLFEGSLHNYKREFKIRCLTDLVAYMKINLFYLFVLKCKMCMYEFSITNIYISNLHIFILKTKCFGGFPVTFNKSRTNTENMMYWLQFLCGISIAYGHRGLMHFLKCFDLSKRQFNWTKTFFVHSLHWLILLSLLYLRSQWNFTQKLFHKLVLSSYVNLSGISPFVMISRVYPKI